MTLDSESGSGRLLFVVWKMDRPEKVSLHCRCQSVTCLLEFCEYVNITNLSLALPYAFGFANYYGY